MKKILFSLIFCIAFQINYSQENHTVNGEILELKTEVEGKLDLLWSITDGKYRYFVRTDNGTITELKNTRDSDKNYLEEYKTTLSDLTNNTDTQKLKFRLYELIEFVDRYNVSVEASYQSVTKKSKVNFRLGVFAGITNNPFVGNPENVKVPLIGGELEIYEDKVTPRHSGFLQARHTFDADDFNYSTNELALGYRYRLISKSKFSIYGQVKLATINITGFTYTDENDDRVSVNDTSFDIPLIFGIGSDIKIGDNSFITIIYGELFALALDNQGNFSTDIALGYKLNL